MILLLLTTKNEADVLELNLRHHLAYGVAHVAVADNESRDHTQDVIRSFGDRVSTVVFRDFADRQRYRLQLLERARGRFGDALSWVGVSDTDEFHWNPGGALQDMLAAFDDEVVCVTCRQKLFLPTVRDPEEGPVYTRQLYRTTGPDSPLHRSYSEGKSFYRSGWLRRINHEHRNRDVPHGLVTPPHATVHHYMIRDEDQFLMKVKRLGAWRERQGLKSKLWYHKLRRLLGIPLPPHVASFKSEWWDVYRSGGDDGLRRYYRDSYRLQERDIPGHLERGELAKDPAFATWRSGGDPAP